MLREHDNGADRDIILETSYLSNVKEAKPDLCQV